MRNLIFYKWRVLFTLVLYIYIDSSTIKTNIVLLKIIKERLPENTIFDRAP